MEQLIFLDKREEQSSTDEIRLSKQFSPALEFPDQGGAISIIDVTLNNNFHKLNMVLSNYTNYPTNHKPSSINPC